MTVLTSDRFGDMDDDELAALYSTRFEGRQLIDLLDEQDTLLLIEVDTRASMLDLKRKKL